MVKRLVTKKNKLFIDDISAEILVHAITFLKKRGRNVFRELKLKGVNYADESIPAVYLFIIDEDKDFRKIISHFQFISWDK